MLVRSSICFMTLCLILPALAAEPQALWLEAKDGVSLRADLYGLEGDDKDSAATILLFHQAGSNRGEYATIAPRLQKMGFHVLAIDQRSGAERWGYENETVNKLGESSGFLAALADLEAALAWKQSEGYRGKTLIWGSSYSSSLVFLLAAKHPTIDAVLSFSPGEYLGSRTDEVRKAAKQVKAPVLVLTPENERQRAQQIVDVLAHDDVKFIVPSKAVHGSSMLVAERNPAADAIWPEVEAFLKRFR